MLLDIYRKFFLSKDEYRVKFKIFNHPNDNIWVRYHDISYLCNEIILSEGKKPNGVWAIYGNSKKNIVVVVYNKHNITINKIEELLRGYGLEIKQIQNRPLKKLLFGLIEI